MYCLCTRKSRARKLYCAMEIKIVGKMLYLQAWLESLFNKSTMNKKMKRNLSLKINASLLVHHTIFPSTLIFVQMETNRTLFFLTFQVIIISFRLFWTVYPLRVISTLLLHELCQKVFVSRHYSFLILYRKLKND